jgi:hypothetical protein
MNRKWKFSIGLAAIVLAATIAFAETNSVNSVALVSTNISITLTNLAQLLALPPEQLEKVDIARMNLLCAEGLRGAENLNLQENLDRLDEWARHVDDESSYAQPYLGSGAPGMSLEGSANGELIPLPFGAYFDY